MRWWTATWCCGEARCWASPGESGSGKSTLAMAAIRLLRSPGVITGGEVLFHSRRRVMAASGDDRPAGGRRMRSCVGCAGRRSRWCSRARSTLSTPSSRIGAEFDDLLRVHRPELNRDAGWERSVQLLEMVGMTGDRLRGYPHELSGGMRQRVMIAMALALEPQVMILDEPTTALDVVTQREILEELMELRDRLGFAALFITHDLSLLVELADEIVVMYAGRLMERAAAASLFRAPRRALHPRPAPLLPADAWRAPADGGDPGLAAGSAGAPQWLCLPSPLSLGHGALPQGDALLSRLDGSGREVACWLHAGDATVPVELSRPIPWLAAPTRPGPRGRAREPPDELAAAADPDAAEPARRSLEGRGPHKHFSVKRVGGSSPVRSGSTPSRTSRSGSPPAP